MKLRKEEVLKYLFGFVLLVLIIIVVNDFVLAAGGPEYAFTFGTILLDMILALVILPFLMFVPVQSRKFNIASSVVVLFPLLFAFGVIGVNEEEIKENVYDNLNTYDLYVEYDNDYGTFQEIDDEHFMGVILKSQGQHNIIDLDGFSVETIVELDDGDSFYGPFVRDVFYIDGYVYTLEVVQDNTSNTYLGTISKYDINDLETIIASTTHELDDWGLMYLVGEELFLYERRYDGASWVYKINDDLSLAGLFQIPHRHYIRSMYKHNDDFLVLLNDSIEIYSETGEFIESINHYEGLKVNFMDVYKDELIVGYYNNDTEEYIFEVYEDDYITKHTEIVSLQDACRGVNDIYVWNDSTIVSCYKTSYYSYTYPIDENFELIETDLNGELDKYNMKPIYFNNRIYASGVLDLEDGWERFLFPIEEVYDLENDVDRYFVATHLETIIVAPILCVFLLVTYKPAKKLFDVS